MWANSVWGFLGLAVAFGLAVLGLPSHFAWMQPLFLGAAGFSLLASLTILCWPLRFAHNRAMVVVKIQHPVKWLAELYLTNREFWHSLFKKLLSLTPRQAPACTHTRTEEKTDKPTVVDEADLIGTARLLYNAEENRLDILKYEKIKSVAVAPVTQISYAQSFRITFAFYSYQGPFDVRINTTGPGLGYFVTENEDRFVIVTASRGQLIIPQSHEAFFRFYRKH